MKIPGQLSIWFMSDIHLGANNTPTEHIVKNLESFLDHGAALANLDMFVIAGDLFDSSIQLSDKSAILAQNFIVKLIHLAARYKFKIRVLEGTPYHDRKQSVQFSIMSHASGMGCDVRYVDSLSVEHIDDLNIDVLYIPDEWHPDPEDTWEDVMHVLNKNGLKQVDFCVMHGMFRYQVPSVIADRCHVEERYLGITKHFIDIGHVHTMSRYERILAQGSFDRLSHGEEEDKGFFSVKCFPDNPSMDKAVFTVNTGAMVYNTYDIRNKDIAGIKKIMKGVESQPPGSHVRVIHDKSAMCQGAISAAKQKHPELHWKSEAKTGENTDGGKKEFIVGTAGETTPITVDNIVELVTERLQHAGIDSEEIEYCLSELAGVLDGKENNT